MSVFWPSNHFHFQPFPWKPLEMATPYSMNTTSYHFHFQPFPCDLETYKPLYCLEFFNDFQFPPFPYYSVIDRGGLESPPSIEHNKTTTGPRKEEPMKPQYEIWNFLGQLYAKIGTRPHVRKDGTSTQLVVWRTHCAKCGAMFEVMTIENPKYLNRRCPEHAVSSRKVKHNVLWGKPIPLADLLGTTPTTRQTKTEKRTAAMFLQEPAAALTTPNLLEKRHG